VFLPIFSNLLTLAGLNILEKGEKRYKHMGKDESSLCKFCSPSTTNLSVRQCVCECVGRHHCWAAGPLGLGFHVSLYIVVHLYAIQQFTILHGIRLGFLSSLPLQPPAALHHPAAASHRCPREAQPSLPGAASFLPAFFHLHPASRTPTPFAFNLQAAATASGPGAGARSPARGDPAPSSPPARPRRRTTRGHGARCGRGDPATSHGAGVLPRSADPQRHDCPTRAQGGLELLSSPVLAVPHGGAGAAGPGGLGLASDPAWRSNSSTELLLCSSCGLLPQIRPRHGHGGLVLRPSPTVTPTRPWMDSLRSLTSQGRTRRRYVDLHAAAANRRRSPLPLLFSLSLSSLAPARSRQGPRPTRPGLGRARTPPLSCSPASWPPLPSCRPGPPLSASPSPSLAARTPSHWPWARPSPSPASQAAATGSARPCVCVARFASLPARAPAFSP
jgi:hypothetical protein